MSQTSNGASRENTVLTGAAPGPRINRISMDAPWSWLAKGWRDMWRQPALSLGYGFAFVVISAGLTGLLVWAELFSLVLPLGAGFLLVGPLLAVGLYEISRRLEQGAPVTARDVIFVAVASPVQLAYVGVMLALIYLAWIRIATLLFAIFFGVQAIPPFEQFFPALILEPRGLALLVTGTVIGGILALVTYAATVVSIPMLLDRDVDAVTAVLTSIQAVRANPAPMLLWAWLILVLTAFGIASLFIGLIVTFPLVGHATWHAYRDVIARD